MKLGVLMDLMAIEDGDELFEKVKKLLSKFGIDVYSADGSVKDMYTVLCEVAEVWNKER